MAKYSDLELDMKKQIVALVIGFILLVVGSIMIVQTAGWTLFFGIMFVLWSNNIQNNIKYKTK